jgi:GNAT superfamily N-acetyltransferase
MRHITDEDEIVKLFPLFIAEGLEIGADISKLNPDKLWNTLNGALIGGKIYVHEEGDKFVGCIVICPIDSYWSDGFVYHSLLYYVLPQYRKSMRAIQLLRAARDFAIKEGVEFNLTVETYTDIERKDKLFNKLGFRKMGGYYTVRG